MNTWPQKEKQRCEMSVSHIHRSPRGPEGLSLSSPPERELTGRQMRDQGEEGQESWCWGGRSRRQKRPRDQRANPQISGEGLKE